MPHTVLLVPVNVSTLQSKRRGVQCGETQSPAESVLTLPPPGFRKTPLILGTE